MKNIKYKKIESWFHYYMNTMAWTSKPIHLHNNSSIELEITQISLVVVEHLQKLGCLLGLFRCVKWTNDHAIVHLWAKTIS